MNATLREEELSSLREHIFAEQYISKVMWSFSVILGDTDAEHYESFIPHHDLSRFDSGDGTVNQNNSRDARWNKALFIADGLENVRIHGNGTIDGRHVFDPLGEENMRGPHCIIAAECSNLSIEGITITRASNYAVMCYAVSNSEFRNLNITEGWDGIHIRGGDNILIDGCNFEETTVLREDTGTVLRYVTVPSIHPATGSG